MLRNLFIFTEAEQKVHLPQNTEAILINIEKDATGRFL